MNRFVLATFVIVSAFSLIGFKAASAQNMMMGDSMVEESFSNETDIMHEESIEDVLQDLLVKYDVNTVQELDCSVISNEDLERLGDAVMEQNHPGESHEVMDRMMGGEGSESLEQMHINMGYAYLGCTNSGYGMGMTNLRQGYGRQVGEDFGYPGSSRNFSSMPMMGYGNMFLGGYSVLIGLVWISLIIFLLSGTYFFIKKSSKK